MTRNRMYRGVVIGGRPKRVAASFSDLTVSKIDALVRVHTGYKSLAAMCRSNPTLRAPPNSSKKTKKDFSLLRKAYKHVTGKEANK